jgi:hypothetical protein
MNGDNNFNHSLHAANIKNNQKEYSFFKNPKIKKSLLPGRPFFDMMV